MPRSKRIRPKDNNAIYHIIIKSISEVKLFDKDCDKEMYLSLVKKYEGIHNFKVYSYCLMTNHAHFIIYTQGKDISKIMHDINTAFVRYFNTKHKRKGPLFYDRFKSIVVNSDKYLITLSGYIHNNPRAINAMKSCPENYKYSSLSVYLGLSSDKYKIIDENFVMQLFGTNVKGAREDYYKFINLCEDKKLEEAKLENNKEKYESNCKFIIRDFKPHDVMEYVSKETKIDKIFIATKNSKKSIHSKSLVALLMRCLCDLKCRDISKFLGDISEARVSILCNIAVKLINSDERYKNIVNNFIEAYSV